MSQKLVLTVPPKVALGIQINYLNFVVRIPALKILSIDAPDSEDDITLSQMQCYNHDVFWTKMATGWVRSPLGPAALF